MSDQSSKRLTPLAEDLMIGAEPIAAWLGVSVRQIFYMHETKKLPLFKIGGRVAGRKSKLMEFIEELERT
jgi:hypothetical protein